MIFRPILYASDDYRLECELRNAVLRKPLGLDLYAENLAPEQHQLHFGLFEENGSLAACVIALCLSPVEAKIRQMAVRPDIQRRGLGRRIMTAVESRLAARGIQRVTLHARITAAGFYEKLGYMRQGDEFIEVTLPHVAMTRTL